VQTYLDSGAIRFKFNNRVKQRPISFQSVTPGTTQGDKQFGALERSVRLCPISSKCSRWMQGAHFRSHAWSSNQHIQKVRGSRLISLNIYLMLFICAAPRTKSKGLPIDVPYHLSYAFYMCSTAYKKQGGPNWRLFFHSSNNFCTRKVNRS
jgi:hypothetical protein